MAKAAHDRSLKAAFEKHRAETETHVSRLEQVFGAIDAKPQGKTCHAILGTVEEGGADREGIQRLSGAGFLAQHKRSSTMKSHATARFEPGRDGRGTLSDCRDRRESGGRGGLSRCPFCPP
jgi:hypothetical protein